MVRSVRTASHVFGAVGGVGYAAIATLFLLSQSHEQRQTVLTSTLQVRLDFTASYSCGTGRCQRHASPLSFSAMIVFPKREAIPMPLKQAGLSGLERPGVSNPRCSQGAPEALSNCQVLHRESGCLTRRCDYREAANVSPR